MMRSQQRKRKYASNGGFRKGLFLVFLVLLAAGSVLLGSPQTGLAQTEDQPGSIWGKLEVFTNTHVVVDGKRYTYAKDVIIHTRSLTQDKRGNVKITLDARGQVLDISFYGIDEPVAFEKYFRD
ncbi:MAG: hypothetical protein ACREIH_04275 [Nitrospiraceae bacterium]